MSINTSILRLRAGASAISVFVGVVIIFGVLQFTGLELPAQAIERGAVDEILPNLAANTTAAAYVVWGEVILWIVLTVFGIDLYRLLSDGRSALLFAPLAMMAGAVLIIIELLLLLGISQGLAPAYTGATGGTQTAIAATALALFRFRNRMILVSGVLFAIAAIIFGREMYLSPEFPNSMGYFGYVAGAVGVIGGFFPLFVPLFQVRSLGLFLFVLWTLLTGIILLRRR